MPMNVQRAPFPDMIAVLYVLEQNGIFCLVAAGRVFRSRVLLAQRNVGYRECHQQEADGSVDVEKGGVDA